MAKGRKCSSTTSDIPASWWTKCCPNPSTAASPCTWTAEQLLHLTDANYGFAAAATGVTSPVLASISAVYLAPNQPYPTNTNLRPAENKTSAKMSMMGLLENLMVPR